MNYSILSPDTLCFLVPIVAIVMGMGKGILSLYLNYRKRSDMFALYHQERMAAIEKGLELPPLSDEFFQDAGSAPPPFSHGTLLVGLILVFVGLTLYLSLHFNNVRTNWDGDAALFGLIPAGIGAAFLIYYFTVGRKLAASLEQERKARLEKISRDPKAFSQ